MRLSIVKSPNAKQFYVIESFTTKTGKRTSRIVEKFGNENEVIKKAKRNTISSFSKIQNLDILNPMVYILLFLSY